MLYEVITADVVMEIEKANFEELLEEMKHQKGVELDTELDANDLIELVSRFLKKYEALKGVITSYSIHYTKLYEGVADR